MKTIPINACQRVRGRGVSTLNGAILAGLVWLVGAHGLHAQPTIVTQPANQTNDLGTTATFRVEATGTTPLSYEWRRYTNASQFSVILNSTSETLSMEDVKPTPHAFRVVVSDVTGSVTSRLALLVVSMPPTIRTNPLSQTGTAGGSVRFSVSASGATPLSYQWRFGGDDLAGATNSTLLLTSVGFAQLGEYSVVVTNRLGSITSEVARLSLKVRVNPPFDPQLSVALDGDEVRLAWRGEGQLHQSISPNGPWTSVTSTGETWSIVSSNTESFYRLTNPHPRSVDVILPSTYRPGVRLPLVLALHGYGDSGPSLESYIHFQYLADSRGFIYTYPNATSNSARISFWNSGDACCNFFGSRVDDVAFLRSLIEEVDRVHGVDRKRIHLFGHSNGGFMSYRMACAASDLIASIASLAGMTSKNSADCQPTEPVSILHIHGTADNVVFYNGGRLCTCITGVSSTTPPAASALETIQAWAGYNGCSAPVTSPAPILDLVTNLAGQDTVVTEYQNHPAGGAVELWSIQGGDHGPAFSGEAFGRIVDWLLAHPKP